VSALEPTLRIGGRPAALTGRAALSYRVLTVLSTQPGLLPWRADFGCRLTDLVGQPASPAVLTEAEWRVRSALARWVPDATLLSCRATAIPLQGPVADRAVRQPPEYGLLALGGEALLRISVQLSTPEGALPLTLDLRL